MKSIKKTLSANDVGTTGAHQAGMHVPKEPDLLSFFPALDKEVKNPRSKLVVRELADGTRWEFNYIYYNNFFFGGTRNEYRLTCMTRYLRCIDAREGDTIVFSKNENGSLYVGLDRAGPGSSGSDENTLVLGNGWKVINF